MIIFYLIIVVYVCQVNSYWCSKYCTSQTVKQFENFKTKFPKTYDSRKEERWRYHLFSSTLAQIRRHNEKYKKGNISYKMGVNAFTDRDAEELDQFNGLKSVNAFIDRDAEELDQFNDSKSINAFIDRNEEILDQMINVGDKFNQYNFSHLKTRKKRDYKECLDWRDFGAVTAVKDQGACACCWAFAVAGAVEGRQQILNPRHPIISLSGQQLVDCDSKSQGCTGGFVYTGFQSINKKGGLVSSARYPYVSGKTGKTGTCNVNKLDIAAKLSGYTCASLSESQLMNAIQAGPLAVSIYFPLKLYNYKSGIFTDVHCDKETNHAVVLTGYGIEKGEKYWTLKNSYGPKWGEKGYFRIARDVKMCGIGSFVCVPYIKPSK